MDELTPEQQQELNKALKDSAGSVEKLKEELMKAGDAGAELYAKIESGLKNSLGAMMNTATEAEKLLQIAQNSFELAQERVRVQETLASNQQKILEKEQQLKKLAEEIKDAKGEEEESLNAQKEKARSTPYKPRHSRRQLGKSKGTT